MSRPNVADWQYLGVDKITRRLGWNSGRKARKGHICEDSLAYASYSSKDIVGPTVIHVTSPEGFLEDLLSHITCNIVFFVSVPQGGWGAQF